MRDSLNYPGGSNLIHELLKAEPFLAVVRKRCQNKKKLTLSCWFWNGKAVQGSERPQEQEYTQKLSPWELPGKNADLPNALMLAQWDPY